MTTAEKTLKWWNDYLEQNKTYPLVAEIEMQLNLAVDNEKQVKNIDVIHCCKSDSELLKVKKEISFKEWANSNGYTHSKCDPNNYRKDSLIIDEVKLKKQYKERNL